MATKNKASEKTRSRKRPTKKAEEPKVIRKAIYLSALIYVEGDQPAPDDYAKLASSALRDVLAEVLDREHNGLRMEVKGIDVRNDIEEDEEEETQEHKRKEKFQF